MKIFQLGIILTSLSLFAACDNGKDAFSEIVGNDKNGLIRGISVNDFPEKVKAAEDPEAIIIDEAYTQTYEYQYAKTDVNINYAFDDQGLYKIEIISRCQSEEDCLRLFDDFSKYYSQKYGQAETSSESRLWLIDANSKIIEIRKLSQPKEMGITVEALE